MKKIMMATMNGWEFLEMVKKIRWKRMKSKGYEWHQGEAKFGDRYTHMQYVNFGINRKNFIGWDYWFDKPFPDEYFDEPTEIYYLISDSIWKPYIEEFLKEHGFIYVNIKPEEIE